MISGGPRVHVIHAPYFNASSIQRPSLVHVTFILKYCVGLSPTGEKLRESIGFKNSDDSKGLIFPSDTRKAEHIIL